MISSAVVLFLLLPLWTTDAFSASSLSLPAPPSSLLTESPSASSSSSSTTLPDNASPVTLSPWRLTLDIGREPLSSMPGTWARSGCRLPIVIPCDILSKNQQVVPQKETVSFTGPNGAVVRPVLGGDWKLDNGKEISFALTFPEYMDRRDVWVDAGTTVHLSARVYTQQELDRLNEEFYQARDEAWELGGELNEIGRRQAGPKKWNEERQQWEKQTEGIPSLLTQLQKRLQLAAAQAKQQQKANQRPRLKDLSKVGSLPGIEDNVYIAKQGTIKIGNAVAGTWAAEPITKIVNIQDDRTSS